MENQFKINDYDIIGFDLDNSLVNYNLYEMLELTYKLIADVLVTNKNYSAEYLSKPAKIHFDFLQKGLIIDISKGNFLKISEVREILKAAHGTTFMNEKQIEETYGKEKKWNTTTGYIENPLGIEDDESLDEMRTILSYFDMPTSLAFARTIDSLHAVSTTREQNYNIWGDVFEALVKIYKADELSNTSLYFRTLKNESSHYIEKTNEEVIAFLKELKKTKSTYLLTGSNVDFANLTATYALGANWQELFDIVITFGRKPGFFIENHSFYNIRDNIQTTNVSDDNIQLNFIYNQGNWKGLERCLKKKFNLENVKHLYVGDNLIQDIYTPSKFHLDTIAIVDELMENKENKYPCILTSKQWGSYFQVQNKKTIWQNLITKHSKICVSKIDILAKKGLHYKYLCFTKENEYAGFYRMSSDFI